MVHERRDEMNLCFESIWPLVRNTNSHYALSEDQVKFIIDHALLLPEEPTILELGVCHGRTLAALSAVAMCKGGWAYGIDHFGLEGDAIEVRRTLYTHRLSSWTLIVGDTRTVTWERPIDLLVIDAGHDEANVRPDIEKYVPLVKHGGYVFFDDYDDPKNRQSPHWAVRHYADLACGSWHDLGIVKRSKEDEFGAMRGWRRP